MLSKELSNMTIICPKILTGNYNNQVLYFCLFLYECKTWSFTLMEERRLRIFENEVLRKIAGLQRDEVTGEWRKRRLLLTKYYSDDQIKGNAMGEALTLMGDRRGAYNGLVGRPEGKSPLERPRR